jgi:hypothetical protein
LLTFNPPQISFYLILYLIYLFINIAR